MKILLVSQYFWPEFFLINSLASELNKRGHQIDVLTGLPNYPSGKFNSGYSFWKGPWHQQHEGVQIIRVPLIARGKGFLRLALNYASFIFFGIVSGLFRVPKNPDVIFFFAVSPITSGIPAILIKWITKKPLVIWVQDLWPESVAAVGASNNPHILKMIGWLVRFIYSQCDLVLVQSEAFKENILNYKVPSEKIFYIPNWASTTPENPPEVTWLNELPEGFKITFAGNIGKAQSVDTVLNAAILTQHVPDLHWVFVGDGSELVHLKNQITEKKLHATVHTFGRRPNSDMPRLFQKSDALLVSLSKQFIFSLTVPSKVQAYMSAGRPILSSLDGEGNRIIALAKAGLCAPAEDPQLLAANAIEMYRMSKDKRWQMGLSGQTYFLKNFEESVVLDKIENLLLKIHSKDSA